MHLDEETVVMIALGDGELTRDQRDHVSACPRCTAELAAIHSLVTTGRAAVGEKLEMPATGVWRAIHSELALTDAVAKDPLQTTDPPTPRAERSASVTPLHRDRSRSGGFRQWWPLAAAALFVGIITGVIGTNLWPVATERVLAEASLEPFPNWNASGSATLADIDGLRQLQVNLDAPSGGLREVWLINPETSGLVSLGLLDGSRGQFSIPSDVDLRQYSVVDISQEPDDGNPAHSGDSIVRGSFTEPGSTGP
ncbi:hypothetical protein GCM10027056_13640 [Glaciibacter psychrotolerans]